MAVWKSVLVALLAVGVGIWLFPEKIKWPLRVLHFLPPDNQDHKLVGYFAAGAFIIARNPEDQELYTILGKDYHTNRWADFGGFRDLGETDPLQTACRELIEETSNRLPKASNLAECMTYIPKCTTVKLSYFVESREASVHQYVVVFPYEQDYPTRLLPSRGLHEWIFHPFSGEKIDMKWIKLSDLHNAIHGCCANNLHSECPVNDLLLRSSVVKSLCLADEQDAFNLNNKTLDATCFSNSIK